MRNRYPRIWILFIGCMLALLQVQAQQQLPGTPLTLQNAPQRDTNANKSNTNDWATPNARVSFRKLHSEKVYEPDTSIRLFHRRRFSMPWYRTTGNHGAPQYNNLFTPEYRVGPSLGYHVFDNYMFNPDSLNFYNTNHPYAEFSYQLGSKLEQTAQILYTQNINPTWNFAVQYRKPISPGFYQIQRTNHDNGSLSTNYQSKNQRYELFGAVVYNKEQNDENGGIVSDSFLSDPDYGERRSIPVNFENGNYGNTGGRTQRSAVTNVFRDFEILAQHGYTFGRIDTTYSEDSSQYRIVLTPRFRVSHRMQYISQKHSFTDMDPDSLRYVQFFRQGFLPGADNDSVVSIQKWGMLDNRVLLNSFFGPKDKQLQFSAGAGMRSDKFTTEYITGEVGNSIFSTYVVGELKKEALNPNEWFYRGYTQFYLTGEASGNMVLEGEAGRDLGLWGVISAGVKQNIGNAPYAYTYYQNQYDTITASFNKESVTQIYGTIESLRLRLSGGVRNNLIGNYIYLNESQLPAQYGSTFNLMQVWIQKAFKWRNFILDNEFVFQQFSGGAPVNAPVFMGRNQFCFESNLFHSPLRVAVGVEIRYHSPYTPAAYSPFFNRFYYQDTYNVSNSPETSAFFNFRIKRFRAYIMGDQLQVMLGGENIKAAPGYPGQDPMVRFGFTWVLIN